MTDFIMRKVGGCVRDDLLGLRTKDIDFSVEAPALVGRPAEEGFNALREHLEREGFHIFVETPEHLTIRAQFPRGHALRGVMTADFVLCRREGPYSDGRRPDFVHVGTLADDLARRDFTVNAMAEDVDGTVIDLFGGQEDLATRTLRCVGDPFDRFREDALRVLRALRFIVVKDFEPAPSLSHAVQSDEVIEAVAAVSVERREHELRLMFQHDTIATLEMLQHRIRPELCAAAMSGIKLNPTTKRRLPSEGPTVKHTEAS